MSWSHTHTATVSLYFVHFQCKPELTVSGDEGLFLSTC